MPELNLVLDQKQITAVEQIGHTHTVAIAVGRPFGFVVDKFWVTLEYLEPKNLLLLGIDLGKSEMAVGFIEAMAKGMKERGGPDNG